MNLGAVKEQTVAVHSEHKIKRNRNRGGGSIVSIVTEPENEMYRTSFSKHRRLSDQTSVPFGYI